MYLKSNFLDYYTHILQKVSFDRSLLLKEYRKAANMLDKEEIRQLNRRLREKEIYPELFITEAGNRLALDNLAF
jgi:hypothetical protein